MNVLLGKTVMWRLALFQGRTRAFLFDLPRVARNFWFFSALLGTIVRSSGWEGNHICIKMLSTFFVLQSNLTLFFVYDCLVLEYSMPGRFPSMI